MKSHSLFATALTLVLSFISLASWASGDDKSAAPSKEDMAKMEAMGQPGPNHKLLAELVGTWDTKATFQLAPGAPPSVATGTTVRKPLMGGRYFQVTTTTKMQMPGADGKMHAMDYQGMEIEGYDNMKGEFFSTWIDSTGTSLLISKGSYDPASKTFTYHLDEELVPGKKTKVRETTKVLDHNHYVFDWYQDDGGKEDKTMEITYARE